MISAMTPGTKLPDRNYLVDQALINRYAILSGDINPLHLDPEFARTTIFGKTIGHGMMTLAFISQSMREWAHDEWDEHGHLRVTFVAPVFAGDKVVVRAEVKTVTPGAVLCHVECWVDDRLTLTGEAGIRQVQQDG